VDKEIGYYYLFEIWQDVILSVAKELSQR